MGNFSIRHSFSTDLDTFWTRIFFDEEYNRKLFVDALKFKSYQQLELKHEPNGTVMRRLRTEPSADAPAVLRKLIGDSLSYVETGRFDPVTKRWTFDIVPSKLADKISTKGEIWVEPKGPKLVERVVSTTVTVKIFGVGGIVESFVEKTTRESYDKAAVFTNQYIAEKGW